jgi:multiple sugar transport system substrate-binding protein
VRRFYILCRLATFLGLVLSLAGCPQAGSNSNGKPVAQPLAGVKIRLAVVDDPELAAAVVRARGEWNVQTGSDIEVVETSEKDLLGGKSLPGDAAICPAGLMGVLAERGWLARVPKPLLHGAGWSDVFPLPRLREATWGSATMGVPFGSPVFCCCYRADLLKKLGRRPPRTWGEYQELAKLLAENSPRSKGEGAWYGTIEPLAPGWAGLVLLARAAPYAKHRDNYSTLFDIETMEPLVAGPPFVQALQELAAAAKLGPADALRCDPAAVRAAFWSGRCGMALTWPTAAKEGRGERDEGRGTRGEGRGEKGLAAAVAGPDSGKDIRVGFAELPGSRKVFNVSTGVSDRRADDESPHVPLLSIAGRLGVVGKDSPQADAAFQLLLWLSDGQMSPQISAASPATTLFRQSNLPSAAAWVEKSATDNAAAQQYADVTEAALRHEQWLGALRVPGRAEYLAALDNAVAVAVGGKKSPQDALTEAAAKWREITKRLGAKQQRSAYRHSLGLGE